MISIIVRKRKVAAVVIQVHLPKRKVVTTINHQKRKAVVVVVTIIVHLLKNLNQIEIEKMIGTIAAVVAKGKVAVTTIVRLPKRKGKTCIYCQLSQSFAH